jgi:hypothetical protein
MVVVQINATCGVGSTGKICVGISQLLSEASIGNYILYLHQNLIINLILLIKLRRFK